MEEERLLQWLNELLPTHSPSGDEEEMDRLLRPRFEQWCDEVRQDAAGNLIGRIAGQSREGAIQIHAHKDEIGMIVKRVDRDGAIQVRNLGGAIPWKYGEGPVEILTADGPLPAVLCVGSMHTSAETHRVQIAREHALAWEHVYLDARLSFEELAGRGVRAGTRAVVARSRKQPLLLGGCVCGWGLDDKGAVAIMLGVMEALAPAGTARPAALPAWASPSRTRTATRWRTSAECSTRQRCWRPCCGGRRACCVFGRRVPPRRPVGRQYAIHNTWRLNMESSTMLLVLLLAALAGAAAPASAAPRALSTGRFANVFTEGQPVRLTVAAGEADTVVLTDLAGTEVARKEAPAADGDAATVEFGPLPPGYYEASAGGEKLPLVVLIDPARRVPGESRLAVDNAMSWLVKPEQFEPMADLLQAAGVGWVRERLSWGEVEPERGKFQWGKYDASATALSKRGIHVYQIFHASPAWSRADKDGHAAPEDLRDGYRFARALARHFQGRVQAWEVWNEPDISFFSHPASECAAFQKACFLGFRAEDPKQLVLGPSMAMGAGPFADHLLANGAGHYLDVWNYHIYADPSAYAGRGDGFRALLARHGVSVPYWVTEAGDPVHGPAGVLTRESRIHQAAFLSRAFPQALAAGEDRHFWFVFPFYREGETGWGLFEPAQKAPFPALAALATATYAMGHGAPLGRLPLAAPEAHALAFARGNGTTCLAVWRDADAPAEVALPLQRGQVLEVRSHVGTPVPVQADPVRVSVGRAAVFVILRQEALQGKLQAPPAPAVVKPAPKPGLPQIVVRLRAEKVAPNKDADAYIVNAGAPISVAAEAYNFGDAPFTGVLRVAVPAVSAGAAPADRWTCDWQERPVTIAPGERAVFPLQVSAPDGLGAAGVQLTARAGKKESAPAILNLRVDPARVKPREALALPIEKPDAWRKNIAGHGDMETAAVPEGGVRFTFTFRTNGDNWAYPEVRFTPPLNLSAYDGIRLEYRTSVADSGPVRLMLGEPGGATYFTGDGLPGSTEWRRATLLFRDLVHLGMSPADPDGRLDSNAISVLRFGANCKSQALVLEVRSIEAVKL